MREILKPCLHSNVKTTTNDKTNQSSRFQRLTSNWRTSYRKVSVITCSLAVMLITFCFGTSQLYAAIYYVSPLGNDSNIGNDLKPFRTLQKAADVTLPGDIVVARDGVYTSTGDAVLDIKQPGLSGAYITFKSENPQGAIIDGKGNTTSYGIILWETAAYIRIEGFDIRYTKTSGIYGWGSSATGVGSHDIIISNNIIHNIGNVTVTDPADAYGRAGFTGQPLIHHYTFEGNTIHNIGRLSDSAQEHAYRHDHGLYLQGKNMTVRRNVFYNHTAGWAIKVDGYWGDEVGTSENSHVISENVFRPAVRNDINGGGYIRFYNNRSNNVKYGDMKPPKNILIESNSFYKPTGPGTDSAVVIDNDGCCNFIGTVLRSNITTSSHLYSENIAGITANVTAVGNILNAADSLFTPKSPTGLRFILK